MDNKKIAIAYIPVLHKGYLSFLEEVTKKGIDRIYLVSDDILASHEELDYIHRKDRLRALPHDAVKAMVQQLTPATVASLTISTIMGLLDERVAIVTPREDINEFIIETYFGGHQVEKLNTFLRWNKENVGETDAPNTPEVSLTEFEKEIAARVLHESTKSADWWRQVGAAIIKDEKIIALAHNEHMPEKELPNILGDTRSMFKKGVNIEYVTTAHAEVAAIGDAAKAGVSTEGATLFTTDFPCPYCARLIAKSGIKKIYYEKGYAVLGGDNFFNDMGIEVNRVNFKEQE